MAARTKFSRKKVGACSMRFEATKLDAVFEVLDALAWLNLPTVSEVSQFAGIDPRTAGKLLKNSLAIGLIESVASEKYLLLVPYPHKGALEQKKAVVREALVKMQLLKNVRQFLKLGESLDSAQRKAASIQKVENYDPAALMPLLEWAKQLQALDPLLDEEEVLDSAERRKILMQTLILILMNLSVRSLQTTMSRLASTRKLTIQGQLDR